MLVVISPAKKLDMEPVSGIEPTKPVFQKRAVELAGVARDLSVGELQKLMHISENLAKLNADRFADFKPRPKADAVKPAVLAFAGDTYQGLEAGTLDKDDLDYAQDHLRILSGLYGALRPLDDIQPYRLEMGSRLKNEHGNTLYDYWGADISKLLNKQAKSVGTDTLVNCASQEYFGAVDLDALKLRVITPVFMEMKNGAPKIVSFYAKKARGAMARFMIERRITMPEGLKDFDSGGYAFNAEMTEGDRWVFLRDYPT
ncbi:MAG: peroxide stress protein YaaA [Pseudomonadota bacterium]